MPVTLAPLFLIVVAAAACAASGGRDRPAAPASSGALHEEIARQDAALFGAYNAHDHVAVMTFFDPDLEFFHDTGGLQTYAQVQEGISSVLSRGDRQRRELVPGTQEVHPVPGYGAIQVGTHRFCHEENGRDDCGTYRFAHVWRQQEGRWQITRVLSYGH